MTFVDRKIVLGRKGDNLLHIRTPDRLDPTCLSQMPTRRDPVYGCPTGTRIRTDRVRLMRIRWTMTVKSCGVAATQHSGYIGSLRRINQPRPLRDDRSSK
jgi:hypothetical protein